MFISNNNVASASLGRRIFELIIYVFPVANTENFMKKGNTFLLRETDGTDTLYM